GGCADRDDALLPALAEDAHHLRVAVEVAPVEGGELAHPYAARVEELQNRAIATRDRRRVLHAVEDAEHLVDGEVRRQKRLALRTGELRHRIVAARACARAVAKEVFQRGELPRDRALPLRARERREVAAYAVNVGARQARPGAGQKRGELLDVGLVRLDRGRRGVHLVAQIRRERIDRSLRPRLLRAPA